MSSVLGSLEDKSSNKSTGGGGMLGALGLVVAVVALGFAGYLFVQLRDARRQIAGLSDQATNADKKAKELDQGLGEVRGQTSAIAERAGITEAELEKMTATAVQLREAQRKGQQHLTTLGGEVGQVKEDVAAQKAAIAETNERLQRAMGDLGEQSGLIARNADELAALKRTGLREYYEFNVSTKTKSPSAVGPVAVRLKDADAKRHKFNMVLVVDDVEIEKKDKTLLEPVQFYRKGSRALNEIVVYGVEKDRIIGYLSAPKAAEAAAAAK